MLPTGYSRKNPNILIPLFELDTAELSNLIIAECEKQGLSEKEANIVVEEAERQYAPGCESGESLNAHDTGLGCKRNKRI